MAHWEFATEARCKNKILGHLCNKLLYKVSGQIDKTGGMEIEIKCPKCKRINVIKL